jgi:hypothetical protein
VLRLQAGVEGGVAAAEQSAVVLQQHVRQRAWLGRLVIEWSTSGAIMCCGSKLGWL